MEDTPAIFAVLNISSFGSIQIYFKDSLDPPMPIYVVREELTLPASSKS